MTTRLLLVRHAESEWNAAGRWQGWGDPPLSEAGRRQAADAARSVRGLVDVIYTSDLVRAVQTAEEIANALGLGPPAVEPGVREIDIGEWTGLTMDEIDTRYPGMLQAWRQDPHGGPPGREDPDAFRARTRGGLERIAAAHPGARVLVVTHGGVISRLERELGVWPGRGVPHLGARWFEAASPLRAAGDRWVLLPWSSDGSAN